MELRSRQRSEEENDRIEEKRFKTVFDLEKVVGIYLRNQKSFKQFLQNIFRVLSEEDMITAKKKK